MRNTSISWCQDTWNITDGCSREMAEGATTSGCGDPTGGGCYAEAMAYRFSGPGMYYDGLVRMTPNGPRWTGKVRLNAHKLDHPLRWRGDRLIFVCSTSDPFHPKLTNEQIAAIYGAMAATGGRHIFQMLTKRAKRRREWHEWVVREAASCNGGQGMSPAAFCFIQTQRYSPSQKFVEGAAVHAALAAKWPLPHVWEGASVEHQPAAYARIDDLLMTPAALRWLSIEPMIGRVDLEPWFDPTGACDCGYENGYHCVPRCMKQAEWRHAATQEGDECGIDPTIDWVVAGAESGRNARTPACEAVNWYRELRDQCEAARVPFFLKQAVGTDGIDAGELTQLGARSPRFQMMESPMLDGRYHLDIPGRHIVATTPGAKITQQTWG